MSGRERNQRCPCGSGLKTKRCPGPHLDEIEAAYRENDEREFLARMARVPRRRSAHLMVATAAALLAVPPVRR